MNSIILDRWQTVLEEDVLAQEDDGYDSDEEQARNAAFLLLVHHQTTAVVAEERSLRRVYLTRPDLLPNPRHSTPFQQVLYSENDRAYITTMGLDIKTFRYLLCAGFEEAWNSTPIIRNDVASGAEPKAYRRSLDAAGALGLILHWINSTMLDKTLAQVFALVPAVITRYRSFALALLLQTLRKVPEGRICWPATEDEFEALSDLVCARHPRLKGAFGSVDGLNLPTATSSDERLQNAQYNGWLHGHYTSSVIVFAASGEIIHAVINAPGSWHDALVARSIYRKLETKTPEGFFLAADTAFPHTLASIASKIHTPVKTGSYTTREELQVIEQLVSFRQSAEWGMRAIQGSFGRLRLPLDANNAQGRSELLETAFRLHQIRVRLVGINQLKSVYEPIWTEAKELKQTWTGMHKMLFPDLHKAERVAQFHYVEVQD